MINFKNKEDSWRGEIYDKNKVKKIFKVIPCLIIVPFLLMSFLKILIDFLFKRNNLFMFCVLSIVICLVLSVLLFLSVKRTKKAIKYITLNNKNLNVSLIKNKDIKSIKKAPTKNLSVYTAITLLPVMLINLDSLQNIILVLIAAIIFLVIYIKEKDEYDNHFFLTYFNLYIYEVNIYLDGQYRTVSCIVDFEGQKHLKINSETVTCSYYVYRDTGGQYLAIVIPYCE